MSVLGKGFGMKRIALLFPGQGSQYEGMGKVWTQRFQGAGRLFEEANDILGYDLKSICTEGSAEQLSRTAYAQPALLTVSVMALEQYKQEVGIVPRFSAGHSLGEYTALVSSGVLTFADALRLVQQRGIVMQEAADAGLGEMAAVRGVELEALEALCGKHSSSEQPVVIACCNSERQYVLSGHRAALARVTIAAELRGAQVTRLQVSGPFHSPLMSQAADRLSGILRKYTFRESQWPVISNVTALPYVNAEQIRDGLILQMTHPVMWLQSMRYLKERKVEWAVELGPRSVLKNLANDMTDKLRAFAFEREQEADLLAREAPLHDFIAGCLSEAVAAPNANWNEEEYRAGVIQPVRRLKEMLQSAKESRIAGAQAREPRKEALDCMRLVLQTKRGPEGKERA
ncbi:ACP S-malonyltransferase [Paenibacillus elgii]